MWENLWENMGKSTVFSKLMGNPLFGAFLEWGYPKKDGLFHGKSQSKLNKDDDCSHPDDT